MARPILEILFDYASPWSYLADIRVDRELADLPIEIRRVPVYLRGFAAFAQGPPFSPAKLAYLARDFARCAEHHGVPWTPPAVLPINGLYLLRGHLYFEGRAEADAYRTAAFRAAWVEGANVSDPEVVAELATRLGVRREDFSSGTGTPAIKQKLRANTDAAAERGVFGVPTFRIDDEIFWGQDRLDYVRRCLEDRLCALDNVSDPGEAVVVDKRSG
jgi:2-hydroxychromene-2-carboxylate isomerase